MIVKVLWIAVIFIVTFGIIFVSSFGIKIQEAFYEKSDVIVADDER